VLASRLGIPFETINLLQADSDERLAGGGTGASKSLMASGTAIIKGAEKVREAGRKTAAHVLEAAEADIEFEIVPSRRNQGGGQFRIAGTDRAIAIMERANRIRTAAVTVPPDLPQTLSVSHAANSPPFAYPNGCHIAEVEVDPETGVAEVVPLPHGQRFRRHREPAARRGPGPWRHRPGHRPGAPGACRL